MNRLTHKSLARFRVDPIGVAMPGPRLPQRIRSVIEGHGSLRLSRARTASLVVACAIICAVFLAVTLTRAQSSDAQDWEKAAGGKISFDVASVKQNTSGRGARSNFPLDDTDSYSGDTTLLSATALPLTSYIGFAYKLPAFEERKMEPQLPQWARTERFDIEARAATPSTKDQMRLMMQSLLENRFQWRAHFATHEEPIFLLVFAKPGQTGPQLRPNSDDPPCGSGPPPSGPTPPGLKMDVGEFPPMCNVVMGFRRYMNGASLTTWGARNISMKQLANDIAVAPTANMDRPVVDATGLAGNFDFVMNFGEPTPVEPNVAPVDSGPTFLEALKDQLGLKLQSGTGPVGSLIVDHIEEPTPD